MDPIRLYAGILRQNMDNPKRISNMVDFGLSVAYYYVSIFRDKRVPKSLQYLNRYAIGRIRDSLANPDNSVWVNLFAPSELVTAMDINPLFMEAYSSFMAGFLIEDLLIDAAETRGLSNTLCSFHKTFLGANELSIVRKPKYIVTTSMICDGNTPTFKYLARKLGVPLFVIDVPYSYSKDGVKYVRKQLIELTYELEECFNRQLDVDKLREVVRTENQTRALMKKYLDYANHKCVVPAMPFEMYMLFASHVFIGSPEVLTFYRMLVEDIEQAPAKTGKSVLFIHLVPMFEKNFERYFNFSDKLHISGFDLNYDFMDEIDEKDPFLGIAEKLILNSLNGEATRRLSLIADLVDKLNPDGVIQFCHLGCKQSMGSRFLIKELTGKLGLPFLHIDGDFVDKRNNQEGQNRTRIEAFLEML